MFVVVVVLLLQIVLLFVVVGKNKNNNKLSFSLQKIDLDLKTSFNFIGEQIRKTNSENRAESLNTFNNLQNSLLKRISEYELSQNNQFNTHSKTLNEALKSIQSTIDKQLQNIRDDNSVQLKEMRATVDEKLQTTLEKRLSESFKQVSDRLEAVHKGLGDMQNLATGVGDLQKVLSNVKTRGILGEYMLANILEQILNPGQYLKDVRIKKDSRDHVEFAIKLPGKTDDGDDEVLIPIDSKFPLADYETLQDAYQGTDKIKIDYCQKQLLKTIDKFAKDIADKYIDPPNTTNFAIMFLPIEGLYAEVLRHPGLFEKLHRDYDVTITGPTTLSALLNSLQMGYRTLAIQKRSSDVWKTLSAVKTEFNNFAEQLSKVQKQLNTASDSLGVLKNRRTNAINKKLIDVEKIDGTLATNILEIKE